jgi:hypothetical protein
MYPLQVTFLDLTMPLLFVVKVFLCPRAVDSIFVVGPLDQSFAVDKEHVSSTSQVPPEQQLSGV